MYIYIYICAYVLLQGRVKIEILKRPKATKFNNYNGYSDDF